MSTHPVVKKLLEQMQASPAPPFWSISIKEARARVEQLGSFIGPGPELPIVEDLEIPGPAGNIPARLLATDAPSAVMLFLHGGGWVLGSYKDLDAVGRYLALSGNYAVLMPDYRLAPEHPYPAALEDCRTSLQWLARNSQQLFGKTLPLIVAGASSGGNLAAALTQQESNRIDIRAQFLVYPVLDANFSSASYREFSQNPFLDLQTMQWFWDQYAPDKKMRETPALSPLRQTDFSNHPATVIVAAGWDPLKTEVEAYATLLDKQGVPVACRTFPQVPHGFFTMVNQFDESKQAITFAVQGLSRFIESVR